MQVRPDMLDEARLEGLEVFQLTTEETIPSSHIYIEAQVFTPDSTWFIRHPFLSPDDRMVFFNSDESGLLQAYMVRGW